MRRITVLVDEDTYRRSRVRAAELDTSVSGLVRGFLARLVRDGADGKDEQGAHGETERERRSRLLNEVIEDIRRTRPGFRAADNLSREDLHDRDTLRREHDSGGTETG